MIQGLPSKWYLWEHNGKRFLYGLACDVIGCAYDFYCTNFERTWTERLSRDGFLQKADDAGISTDHTNLRVVLETLSNASKDNLKDHLSFEFVNSSKVKSEPGENASCNSLRARFDSDLEWVFNLQEADKDQHASLMSALNFQQFLNHDFLIHRIKELEKMVSVKDQFIQVLSENYSALGGDNLIKTYKRNNKADLMGIEPYDQASFESTLNASYERSIRNKSKKKGWAGVVSSHVSTAISDYPTWSLTSRLRSISKSSERESLSPDRQGEFVKTEVKREPEVKKEPEIKKEIKAKKEVEPEKSTPSKRGIEEDKPGTKEQKEKSHSPTKRGRTVPGVLPRRKR